MRPDTIQEELFKLFANLGGNVTALNSNSYTIQAWLHQINELVAGGGVGAVKVSPTAPVSPLAGDLWYNPNTGRLGYWSSPYWLSLPVELPVMNGVGYTATTTATYNFAVPYNIYIHSLELRYTNSSGAPTDGSNYFSGTFDLRGWSNSSPTYTSIAFNNNTGEGRIVSSVNTAYVPDVVNRLQTLNPSRLGLSIQATLTETGVSYFVVSALIRYSFIL